MTFDLNTAIQKIQSSSTIVELKSVLLNVTHELGFDYFCASFYSGRDFDAIKGASSIHRLSIANYPENWRLEYEEKKYLLYDPTIEFVKGSSKPFRWYEVPEKSKLTNKQLEMINRAAEHGLCYGYTVPFHNPSQSFGQFCVSSPKHKKDQFEACLQESQYVLQVIALNINFVLEEILQEKVPPLSEKDFEVKTLTAREMQCLEWSARGKSAWEISKILQLSESTIKFHMKNAMRKLGVVNKVQAVAQFLIEDGRLSDPMKGFNFFDTYPDNVTFWGDSSGLFNYKM